MSLIGTFATSINVRSTAALRGNADISRTIVEFLAPNKGPGEGPNFGSLRWPRRARQVVMQRVYNLAFGNEINGLRGRGPCLT
jgi:hypothetical protein